MNHRTIMDKLFNLPKRLHTLIPEIINTLRHCRKRVQNRCHYPRCLYKRLIHKESEDKQVDREERKHSRKYEAKQILMSIVSFVIEPHSHSVIMVPLFDIKICI